MRFYVGVTDNNWYKYLASQKPDEVNFWRPGGRQGFRVLESGGLFLFKLHHPLNFITGGGFFVRYSLLPVSLAWNAFNSNNGAPDYFSFMSTIHKYRNTDPKVEPDPVIGCIILASPFFFEEKDWIPVPEDWKPSIVQGKSYSTNTLIGRRLYRQVQERLVGVQSLKNIYNGVSDPAKFGADYIVRARLGQGAFKVLVAEAYHRRCAVSGERTLPVLEAAHIKPYSLDGPHKTENGLLLRRDIHTLFDKGYMTIDEDLNVEVSGRIKEDYGNGRDYYAFHGNKLVVTPDNIIDRPSNKFIRWHNENIYRG